MDIKFTCKEVKPRIFFLNFKSQYQCGMAFLRYQEYYESPSSLFRGKVFTILDFMEHYVRINGDELFYYPRDWAGFNVPSQVFKEIFEKGIPDPNEYDKKIERVYKRCLKKYPDGRFYIIGAVGQGVTMKHEIAHGFFYTTPKYKEKMLALVKALSPSLKRQIYKRLRVLGYATHVLADECQAYLSTGHLPLLTSKMSINGEQNPFKAVFKRFYEK